MTTTAPPTAFRRMDESTPEHWQQIVVGFTELAAGLPDRVMSHLRLLDGDFGGFNVDRLTHSLQCAHRAETDGKSDEYVVCALLHDVGDLLCPLDHPLVAAAIVKPWVSEAHHWMVRNHAVFQGYYYFHHLGGDRNERKKFEGHEHYELTEEFVRKYDMPAFDDTYRTPPLAHYEPLLRDFFTVSA